MGSVGERYLRVKVGEGWDLVRSACLQQWFSDRSGVHRDHPEPLTHLVWVGLRTGILSVQELLLPSGLGTTL